MSASFLVILGAILAIELFGLSYLTLMSRERSDGNGLYVVLYNCWCNSGVIVPRKFHVKPPFFLPQPHFSASINPRNVPTTPWQ